MYQTTKAIFVEAKFVMCLQVNTLKIARLLAIRHKQRIKVAISVNCTLCNNDVAKAKYSP